MISFVIPLLATMKPLWSYVLPTLFGLFFVATVPCILRAIIGLRGKRLNV